MIKERQDIEFLILTKRIDRFLISLPSDWVMDIRQQCIEADITFWYKSTGTLFKHKGIIQKINPYKQTSLAKELDISILNGKKLF